MDAPPPTAHAGERAPGRRRRRRRWLWIAVAALPLAAWLARDVLVHPVVAWAAERIAPRFGWRLEIGSVHGSWFRTLGVRDLRLRPIAADGPLRALDAETVDCTIRLRELWRFGLASLRSLQAAGVQVDLDLSAAPARGASAPGVDIALPPRLPDARVSRARVAMRLDGGEEIVLDGIEAALDGTQPGRERVEADVASVRLPWLADDVVPRVEIEAAIERATPRAEDGPATEGSNGGGSGAGGGTGERVLVERVRVTAGAHRVEGRSIEAPLRWSSLDELARRARGEISIDSPDPLAIVNAIQPAGGARGDGSPHGAPSPRWIGAVTAELALARGVVRAVDGSIALHAGRLTSVRGTLALDRTLATNVVASASIPDLAPWGELLGTAPWTGALAGEVVLEGDLRAPRLRARLGGDVPSLAGWPLGGVTLRAWSDFRSLGVDAFRARGELGEVDLSGAVDFTTERVSAVKAHARVTRADRVVPGLRAEAIAIDASADGPWAAPSGSLRATSDAVEVGGLRFEGVRVAARARGGRILLEDLAAVTRAGAIGARAEADLAPGAATIDITHLRLAQGDHDLALEAPARIELAHATLRCETLRVRGTAGALALEIARERDAWTGAAELAELDALPFLAPWLPEGVAPGVITAKLRATSAPGGVTLTTEGRARGARANAELPALELAWRGELDESALRIAELYASDGTSELARIAATIPIDARTGSIAAAGPLDVQARIDVPPSLLPALPSERIELDVGAPARIAVAIGGTVESPRGTIELAAPRLDVAPRAEGAWPAWRGALDATVLLADAIELQELVLAGDSPGRIEARGRIAPTPSLARVAETRGGALLDAPLELTVRGELAELGWIAELVPEIRRVGGLVRAELTATGTLREPSARGRVDIEDGELRLAQEFPPIQSIQGEIALEDESLLVRSVRAEIGSAPLVVTGSIGLDAPSPVLALRLEGTNVLLARSSDARLRSDAKLELGGTLDAPRLTGSIGLRKGRLRHDVDFLGMLQGRSGAPSSGLVLFSLREPPLAQLELDVEITAIDPLEFESNVAEAKVRPALQIRGTGEVPAPEGRIFLDDLALDLPGGRFRFPVGTLVFERADPFHPRLDLRGEARLAGYDVTMKVSGTLDEPNVDLSSSPPLPRDRLLLLVLSGTLPPEGVAGSSRLATRSITLYVAKDVVSKWMQGPGDDGESLFDRLEIVTGAEVSKAGVLSTEASLRLREDALGRNDMLYLVAERDVYEDYNMGLRIVFRFP